MLDALDYTMSRLGRDALTGEERHVGGRELLGGIQEYAADQFGPMAALVFDRWGVRRSGDFGEIVFNLIDAELLSRRPTDSRLDFVDGLDFRETFAAEAPRVAGTDRGALTSGCGAPSAGARRDKMVALVQRPASVA